VSSRPWTGGPWGPAARCILAPNPGPMTLEGTNTWLLAAPGADVGVVVDPGPLDEGHLAAVVTVAREAGVRIATVLLTHGHPDHAAGARRFAELTGAPVRALDPGQCLGDRGLVDGDVVTAGALELTVAATPGHTSDSLSFLLAADQVTGSALLTGDTVLGRGTTLIAHPDGRLGDYLASLERLAALAAQGRVAAVLPGHGPVLDDPLAAIQGYLAHRRDRLEQVAAALAAGATTARKVVQVVYADVDPVLWPAAELSVRAQLDYLAGRGDSRGS
jgi:glyoxylase-like metal-dependent hydrolase (beta-lactamase superfamily II)